MTIPQCPHCSSHRVQFFESEYEELPIEYSDVPYEQRRGAKVFLVDEYFCSSCGKTFKEIRHDEINEDDEQ